MQQLLGPDTFEFLARYFLAGWLFLSIRSWWVRGERPKPNEVIFEAITLSLVNQLIALLTVRGWVEASGLLTEGTAQFLVAEVVVQPMLIGFVVGFLADRNWMPDGFRRLMMPAVQPVHSALGFAVDQIAGPSFIIVSYRDGRQIYGFFGEASFARSEASGGLFIESLYTLSEDQDWIEAQPPRAIWASLEDAQSIEFISTEDL